MDNVGEGITKIENYEPPCTMTFNDKDGKEIGRLEFTDGVMAFKGKIEPSAQVFFDWLCEVLVNPYIKQELRKRKK